MAYELDYSAILNLLHYAFVHDYLKIVKYNSVKSSN